MIRQTQLDDFQILKFDKMKFKSVLEISLSYSEKKERRICMSYLGFGVNPLEA